MAFIGVFGCITQADRDDSFAADDNNRNGTLNTYDRSPRMRRAN
jgi:hypothetical protein